MFSSEDKIYRNLILLHSVFLQFTHNNFLPINNNNEWEAFQSMSWTNCVTSLESGKSVMIGKALIKTSGTGYSKHY